MLLVVAVVVAGGGAPSARAAAGQARAECLAAHREAQVLRRDGALIAARAKLLVCGQASCPGVLRADCTGWLADLERELPSIVVRAFDAGGDVTDVVVTIDGVVVRDGLDGRPIELDPGAHALRCARTGGITVERQLLVSVGERARPVAIDLSPPPSSPPPTPPTTTPTTTPKPPAPRPAQPTTAPVGAWVAGGAAAVAVATAAVSATLGLLERSALTDTCAPFCADDVVLPVRVKYAVADVALGAAAVSATTALAFLLFGDAADADGDGDAGADAPPPDPTSTSSTAPQVGVHWPSTQAVPSSQRRPQTPQAAAVSRRVSQPSSSPRD
jgi:hypothetical protein